MISLDKYIEKYIKIKDKQGNIIPFKFNAQQRLMYDMIKSDMEQGKIPRYIVLKSRQMGISTFVECFIAARIMTKYNVSSLVAAHKADSTNALYSMTKLAYQELPNELKPMVKYENNNILVFENPTIDPIEKSKNPGLRSNLRVATAGSDDIGRSLTIQYMHLSEFAFWSGDKDKQLNGLMQAVPLISDSLVVIESTANGYDVFKNMWDKAVNGENQFKAIFFSWKDFPEYQMEYTGFKLTEEEENIKEKFNLTNNQLEWRRYAISTLSGGDIDLFKQEYPLTPEEAFIVSGRPYFNRDILFGALNKCKPGLKGSIENGSFKVGSGNITIWEEVKTGYPYVIGADTAGEGSDYFNAYVIDNTTGRMVARYRSQVDESEFTKSINELGLYYNTALIAIESNFSTYPTLTLEERYKYPNQYVRERLDTFKSGITTSYGFKTTKLTRPAILANLNEVVNESIELILDEDLINEMLRFVKNDMGRPEAMDNEHDDCVMSMAIAQFIRPQQRYTVKNIEVIEEVTDYNSFINYGG